VVERERVLDAERLIRWIRADPFGTVIGTPEVYGSSLDLER
jgi:hypothetical protein